MKEKIKKICLILGFLLLLTLLYYVNRKPAGSIPVTDGILRIQFMKTEDDADCTLINTKDTAILIDTGEKKDAEEIISQMEGQNISRIDYLIISHGDKDHIGAAKKIIKEFEVSKVVAPRYCDGDNLDELIAYIKECKIEIIYPTEITEMDVGEISMTFYPALETYYDKENNYSLAVLISYENVDMLFTGDALSKRSRELEKIEWNSIDLYKVPYHGRGKSESEELFELVNPRIAVVTSDDCDSVIKESAQKCGSNLYFTRPDGLVFISDGNNLILE